MEHEDEVRAFRLALRMVGYAKPRDTWRLAALLEGRVIVEVTPVLRAYTVRARDGRHVITIPERLGDEEASDVLLEELGHWLDERELTPALPVARRDRERLRLALLTDGRAEAKANGFVLAWKLPLDLLDLTAPAWRLAAESGCTIQQVEARLGAFRK